jgi:diacylglycerol kinase
MQKIHRTNEKLKTVLTARVNSIRYAVRGLILLLRTQPNSRLYIIILTIVIIGGIIFRISGWEWCAVFLAASAVCATESLNTALEFLGDHTSRKFDPIVRDAKDVAAAGVLLTALASILVGLTIFIPRLFVLFRR